jgi:hypothetical protein
MRLAATLGCVIAYVLAVGCSASIVGNVQTRAANEMNCPRDQVHPVSIGGGAYQVSACGQQATYTCATEGEPGRKRVVCTREGMVYRGPAGAQAGAPTQAPITAAEDAIGAYLRASVEQRRGSIFGCTGGQEATVVVSAVRDGTVAFALAGGHSGTSMEACVRMALGTQRLDPQPRAVAMLITLTPTPAEATPSPSPPPPTPAP